MATIEAVCLKAGRPIFGTAIAAATDRRTYLDCVNCSTEQAELRVRDAATCKSGSRDCG